MTTPEGGAVARGYGYGLGTDSLGGRPRVQHGGGINGFNAMLQYYPADSLTVVVLGNTNGPMVDRVADNIARAALGLPLVRPPAPPQDLATTGAQRARYLGTYRLAPPGGDPIELRVFERDGQLFAQGTGQGEFALRFQGDDSFVPSFDPASRVRFAAGTPAPSLTLTQGGGTIIAPRVR